MGLQDYRIDGVSGTGKASACAELRRRCHHAIDANAAIEQVVDERLGRL